MYILLVGGSEKTQFQYVLQYVLFSALASQSNGHNLFLIRYFWAIQVSPRFTHLSESFGKNIKFLNNFDFELDFENFLKKRILRRFFISFFPFFIFLCSFFCSCSSSTCIFLLLPNFFFSLFYYSFFYFFFVLFFSFFFFLFFFFFSRFSYFYRLS